ncbi:MAG: hypothetical protein JNL79_31540 [Myxococcales bacterium]|nr:hypothetical protein [Myxococcales bacterium]
MSRLVSPRSFVLGPLAAGLALVGLVVAPESRAETKDAKAAPSASASASAGGGKVNREEFEAALKPNLKEMRDCYDKALKKDAVAEGEAVLIIETQNGKVLKGEVDRPHSSLKLEEALKCIEGVVKKIKMPLAKNEKGEHDPKAKATVKYPVEFSLGIDVSGGGIKTTGAKIEYEKVKQVFFFNKIEIGRCYLDAYKAKKGVAAIGKLLLKVEVAGGKVGKAGEVTPDTTLADADMKACIYDAVKKFKFPLAKDAKGNDDEKATSVIVYPMEFKGQ